MKKYLNPLAIVLLLSAPVLSAQAQEAPVQPAAAATAGAVPAAAAPVQDPPITLTEEEKKAPFTGSFFFTQAEITSLNLAKLGRPAENGDISGALQQIIPPHRVISVAGVFYRSPKDWVVWMNGQKVTPKNLLPEIVDIKVDSNSRLHLKWYDAGLNAVISITMKPNSTYDIGTGILLPGVSNN